MLTPYQLELIHGEVDGENTLEASLEVRQLVETQPEALALMTSLRSLDELFNKVPDRVPPPRVTELIHNAMPLNSRASPKAELANGTAQTISKWAIQQWNGVTNLMGEFMLTKKVLIVATTAVAAIAIIGELIVGYRPSVYDAGTVGAGGDMSGVQQAGRYKGRKMTEADVTLSNPEIHALFQNDQVLKLVQSDAFHQAMRNDAFRELLSSEAFRQTLSSEAFRELLANDASRQLFASDAFREVMANDADHQVLASAAFREAFANNAAHQVLANDAAHQVMANNAFREILANDAFRQLLANDAFREVLANDAFRQLFANDAFREVLTNDAFREVLASDAFRQLQASDAFRAISHSQSLSEAFLSQAMHAQE